MPGITSGASPTPQHGGRRGRWGQARLVGAGEANGGRKPPASCPSLRSNATKATGPNPVPTIRSAFTSLDEKLRARSRSARSMCTVLGSIFRYL